MSGTNSISTGAASTSSVASTSRSGGRSDSGEIFNPAALPLTVNAQNRQKRYSSGNTTTGISVIAGDKVADEIIKQVKKGNRRDVVVRTTQCVRNSRNLTEENKKAIKNSKKEYSTKIDALETLLKTYNVSKNAGKNITSSIANIRKKIQNELSTVSSIDDSMEALAQIVRNSKLFTDDEYNAIFGEPKQTSGE